MPHDFPDMRNFEAYIIERAKPNISDRKQGAMSSTSGKGTKRWKEEEGELKIIKMC